KLYMSSTATDAAIHVYVTDVDENGTAHYVTEGVMKAMHHKVSQETRPYTDVEAVPYHSYLRKDAQPLKPGEITEITFDVLPVSYLFKKGHSIRISISGADKDHFEIVAPGAEWKIYFDEQYPSGIELPVVK